MPAVISRCAECVALVILSGLLLAGCPLPVGDSLLTEEEHQVSNPWILDVQGPYGIMIQQAAGGGYVVAGTGFVVKTDSGGGALWSRMLDGAIHITAMDPTTDGGCVLGTSQGSPSTMSLIKLDESGKTSWTRLYSSSEDTRGSAGGVCQTSDGGYITVGNTRGNSDRQYVFIVKADADGNPMWSKTPGVGLLYSWNYAQAVVEAEDGGYVIAGTSLSNSLFPVVTGSWLLKMRIDGVRVWHRRFAADILSLDVPAGLFRASDGGFLMASKVSHLAPGWEGMPYAQSVEFRLRRANSRGNLLWNRVCDVLPVAICHAPDGGFLLVGNEHGHHASGGDTIRVVKTDDEGQAVWVKSLWSDTYDLTAAAVETAGDGGYVIAGKAAVPDSQGYSNLCLVRMDADGNPL